MSEHAPPSGTVTFLFSDIVGSTAAWESDPSGMHAALTVHDEFARATIEHRGGYIFATGGDGFCAAFARADDAAAAAIEMQQRIAAHPWDSSAVVRVRAGLHTGEAFPTVMPSSGPRSLPLLSRSSRASSRG